MEPLAYSYVRFSSSPQADGDSERRQDAKFAAYCKQHGLQVGPSFKDRGRSGLTAEHLSETGELRRFLDLVEAGEIRPGSVLVVESLDRLGRQEVEDALGVFLNILGKGIKIVTLTGAGAQEFVKGGGVIPLLVAIMEMYRAHSESEHKLDRLRSRYEEKRREARERMKPMGNVCPLWLRLKEKWTDHKTDGSAYEPIPERAEVVRRIFSMAIAGHGKESIAKALTADNVPSFKSTNAKLIAKGHARGWSGSSVEKILKNRAVFGEYQPRSVVGLPRGVPRHKRSEAGEPIQDYFPAVVSEETFHEAQLSRDRRRTYDSTKQAANGSLWQGIAKCEKCGGGMQISNKGKPPKGGRYLRCGNIRNGICKGFSVRLEHSEEVFRGMVARLDALPLVKSETAALDKALRVAEGRMVAQKSKVAALGRRLDEDPESPTLGDLLRRAEAELRSLTQEVAALKGQLAAETSIGWDEFLNRLDLVTRDGRVKANELVKRLGILVYVGPSGYLVTQKGDPLFTMDFRDGSAGYLTPIWGGRSTSFLSVEEVGHRYVEDERMGDGQRLEGHELGLADQLASVEPDVQRALDTQARCKSSSKSSNS